MHNRLEFACTIVKLQGIALNNKYHGLFHIPANLKKDSSFVTAQDKSIEKFLVKELSQKYPDDGFLSEEGHNKGTKSGYEWIIDPIDGTSNYVYRQPLFAISVGLKKDNTIIGGIIYIPPIDKLYCVQKGKGFYVEDRKVHTTDTEKPDKAFCLYSIAHKPALHDINLSLYPIIFNSVKKIRIYGSTSYELVQIASGLVDIMINYGCTEWDVTAGMLMVKEAGGVCLDFNGNEWKPGSIGFIAGNRVLARELQKIIALQLKNELKVYKKNRFHEE